MITFENFRDKRREYAFTKSVSDNPKDQDAARKIRTQMDYDDLKKQIGSKKKPQLPANAVVESDAAFEFVKNKIRKEVGVPLLTDVHTTEQCSIVANHVDVLQIPAFLCRQTDLLVAAAKTGKIINVKKGQFLAPWDMANVIKKIEDSGNKNILITERGASFGYNTLVSDMRALPIMSKFGFPIVFDATHSVQQPGGMGEKSGGQREFVPYLARAAIAVGVGAIFMETHEDPDNAPSDGPNTVSYTHLTLPTILLV